MVLLQGPLPACSAYRHDGSRRHVNVNDEQRGKRPTELASEPLQSSSRVRQTYACSNRMMVELIPFWMPPAVFQMIYCLLWMVLVSNTVIFSCQYSKYFNWIFIRIAMWWRYVCITYWDVFSSLPTEMSFRWIYFMQSCRFLVRLQAKSFGHYSLCSSSKAEFLSSKMGEIKSSQVICSMNIVLHLCNHSIHVFEIRFYIFTLFFCDCWKRSLLTGLSTGSESRWRNKHEC